MEAVKLRQVAITDLSVRYARDLGNKKIRHYRVTSMAMIISKFTGQTAEDLIRDFIMKEEGAEVEFLSPQKPDEGFGLIGSLTTTVGGMQIADVSAVVLQRDRAVKNALLKIKAHSTLLETNYYRTVFHKYYDKFVWRYNKSMAPRINRLLYKLQGGNYDSYSASFYQVPYLSLIYRRDVDPTHFISVGFEAGDATRALEVMREDLRLLHKKRIIKGHLSMPSIMRLADTVGAGRYFVLFCFPVIDHRRLAEVLKVKFEELPSRDSLSLVGAKYETSEGGIKWLDEVDPTKMYAIEEVDVVPITSDEMRDLTMKSYEESKPFFQKAAQRTKEAMQTYEKVESRTEQIDHKHVGVNVTLRNKETGNVVKVDSKMYDKNNQIYVRKEDEE